MNRLRGLLVLGLLVGSILTVTSLSRPTVAVETFTFAAAGDFNRGPEDSRTGPLLDRLQTGGVSFLLALGDVGYGDNEQEWCTWTKAHFNNIIVITGNHETDESGPSDIGSAATYCPFPLSGITVNGAPNYPMGGYGFAYYFDYPSASPIARFFMVPFGNTGCVSEVVSFCFNPGDWEPGNPGHTWLTDAINSAKTAGMWTIVGMHEDCISSSFRGCDASGDYASQEEFDMLFRLGVDLVLHAHNHVYERSKQLNTSAACPTIVSDAPGDLDCIVDAVSPYDRGAGTVVVDQGTGGAGLYDVVCGSAYYAAAMDGASACGGTGTGPDGRGAVKYTVSTEGITAQTDFDTSYSDSFSIGGAAPPPGFSASFTWSPASPNAGQQITFTATASAGAAPYSFTWNMGDGTTDTGASVTHTYSTDGTYTVTLTATDSLMDTAMTQRIVVVKPVGTVPPLTVALTVSPGNPSKGANVVFTATASGGTSPYTYDWDMGDGTRMNGASVSHSYASEGAYSVALTTTDDAGETITSSRTVSVSATGSPPPPSFLPPSLQLDESSLWLFMIGALLGLVMILAVLNLRTRSRVNYARRLIER